MMPAMSAATATAVSTFHNPVGGTALLSAANSGTPTTPITTRTTARIAHTAHFGRAVVASDMR